MRERCHRIEIRWPSPAALIIHCLVLLFAFPISLRLKPRSPLPRSAVVVGLLFRNFVAPVGSWLLGSPTKAIRIHEWNGCVGGFRAGGFLLEPGKKSQSAKLGVARLGKGVRKGNLAGERVGIGKTTRYIFWGRGKGFGFGEEEDERSADIMKMKKTVVFLHFLGKIQKNRRAINPPTSFPYFSLARPRAKIEMTRLT